MKLHRYILHTFFYINSGKYTCTLSKFNWNRVNILTCIHTITVALSICNITSWLCVLIIVKKVQLQEGDSVTMKWPNLIQSFGYNIYHSLKKTRTIMQIENSGATYEGKNHSLKYVYINSQCPLTSISFDIRNIT